MIRTIRSICFSVCALVCLASSANAQASRTWVSGVGDDANPCSRTAPCKTFAGAISKTAAGGEINVLDPGGFGAVTITKSMTIDGTPFTSGILASGSNGINISAGANDVVRIRGLDINGFNTVGALKGISFNSGASLIIEDCDIYSFGQRGISIAPIVGYNPSPKVSIFNTRIVGGLSNGIVIQPADTVTVNVALDNVHVQQNTNFGVSITGGSKVSIRNSVISGHGMSGLRVDGTSAATTLDLDNVEITGNTTGIESITGSTTRVANSSITQNGTGLIIGGTVQSYGNNRVDGNASGNTGMSLISLQ